MSIWLWVLGLILLGVAIYVKRSTLYGYLYFVGYHVVVSERFGYPKHLKLIDPKLHPNKVPHTAKIEPTVLVGDDGLSGGISILPVAILEDNYSYLIVCERTGQCAVVDPADPYVVLDAIDEWNRSRSGGGENKQNGGGGGIQLTHILTTHRHW